MARVIEEPEIVHEHYHEGSDNGSSGMGMLLGLVLLVILAIVFIYYGLPAIRNVSSPQINVPKSIDVNVNK